jgi:hypothetical protein
MPVLGVVLVSPENGGLAGVLAPMFLLSSLLGVLVLLLTALKLHPVPVPCTVSCLHVFLLCR